MPRSRAGPRCRERRCPRSSHLDRRGARRHARQPQPALVRAPGLGKGARSGDPHRHPVGIAGGPASAAVSAWLRGDDQPEVQGRGRVRGVEHGRGARGAEQRHAAGGDWRVRARTVHLDPFPGHVVAPGARRRSRQLDRREGQDRPVSAGVRHRLERRAGVLFQVQIPQLRELVEDVRGQRGQVVVFPGYVRNEEVRRPVSSVSRELVEDVRGQRSQVVDAFRARPVNAW